MKGYPPKIFTNPNYLQNSINSNDTSDSEAEVLARNSKPASDWDEDLIDFTQVDDDASKQDKNPLPSDWSDEGKYRQYSKSTTASQSKAATSRLGNLEKGEKPFGNQQKQIHLTRK